MPAVSQLRLRACTRFACVRQKEHTTALYPLRWRLIWADKIVGHVSTELRKDPHKDTETLRLCLVVYTRLARTSGYKFQGAWLPSRMDDSSSAYARFLLESSPREMRVTAYDDTRLISF